MKPCSGNSLLQESSIYLIAQVQEFCIVSLAIFWLIQERPAPTLDMGSDAKQGCAKSTRESGCIVYPTCGEESMRTLFDILKKDRKGTFQWLETVSDIETAKAHVLQLSSESPDEFIVFRAVDLQVVATSHDMQTDTEALREFPQQRLQSFAD